MQQHIHHIQRVDRRILKIILKSDTTSTPIAVTTSYAPHKGYKHEARNQQWNTLEEIIAKEIIDAK